jgi:CheY-like chemotaxis protein
MLMDANAVTARVLVVDDEEMVSSLFAHMLAEEGYSVDRRPWCAAE